MNEKNKALTLFKKFHGIDADNTDIVNLNNYDVVVNIGECTHIAYESLDGKNYIHKFKKKSRPILAVSSDGKQLFLLKGKYKFTDRGIVDK